MIRLDGAARVFLTGGTGFFGRALLRYLLAKAERGDAVPEVTLLSRSPSNFEQAYPEFRSISWLHLAGGDVQSLSSMRHLGYFTHVLHAATDSTFGPRLSPIDRYDQIVAGTRNVLEFARLSGVRRFLLTSSGGVYGPQPEGAHQIPEGWNGIPDPLDPGQAYSIAKRAAEHLTALYHAAYGIETVVARCFAFVGQDLPLDVHFAIGNFIQNALHADVIRVKGTGAPVRSYMDQEDLAHWLWVMLDRGIANRAYNVGSDEAISLLDLAYLVRSVVAPTKEVLVEGNPEANLERNYYVPSILRAKEELGLRLVFSLEDSILRAAKPHLAAK